MEVAFELRLKNESDGNVTGRELQNNGVAKCRQYGGVWPDLAEELGYNDENGNGKNCSLSTYCVHAFFLIYKPYKIGFIIPFIGEKIFISEKSSNLPTVAWLLSGSGGSQMQM